ncbi:MAG: hypothetical protein KIT84_24760 [Labilithrix sp.]|nr:hypothetical protein [Labilithrix sp.]MCW5814262.1 hypothetical protein [Labilithrix sp.]
MRTVATIAAATAIAGALLLALTLGSGDAEAQKIDPRRPSVLVVGPPRGAAPMQRLDARRSGLSKTFLPSGPLSIAWRKPTGLTIDHPPLIAADGSLVVVSSRGDVGFYDDRGDEKATIKVGAAQVGPAAMTSDGTIVFLSTSGDAMGVRRGASPPIRYTTRIGGERNTRAAPLALDDGGVVVATLTDLVVLDAEGNVRARVTLPEQPAAPLVAAGDKVLAVTSTGAVFGWTPGHDSVRLGSFGAPIDGGAALTTQGTLLAVIEGNHLAEVDVVRGSRATWSIASQGIYLGPPAVREIPGGTSIAMLGAMTHTLGFVLALDPAGQELLRAPVAKFQPNVLPDGGMPPLQTPPHTGMIIDARGAIAFATTDGRIGTIAPDGALDTLGDTFCAKGSRGGVAGLTPFGANAFAVACEGGLIARIAGGNTPPPPAAKPSPSPTPSSSADSDKLRRREP